MRTRISVLAGLMVGTAGQLAAQGASRVAVSPALPAVQNSANAPTDCDYNTCALRMKLSRGSWRIIGGAQENQVAKFGLFTAPNLESIVASSPEAQFEARTFRNNYTSGEVLQALGVVLMGAGIAAASANESAVIPFTGVLGGGALLFYGVTRRVRAFNALNKTIWLYNRSLKR